MAAVGEQAGLTPRRGPRFAGLDGLRAIAVIAVILFHLAPETAPGGYLGVDIFFVLSGFLITSLLLRERAQTGRLHLGRFWLRRARRLLPALIILVPTCCTVAWIYGGDLLVGLGKQVVGAATFSSNWVAIVSGHSYFDETTPELFRNLWSLAVEEQFYLLWPLAVLGLTAIPRRGVRLGLVTLLAVGSAVWMGVAYVPGADATRVYYGTDAHSFGLAAGAALGILSTDWATLAPRWPRRVRIGLELAGGAALLGLLGLSGLMPATAAFPYRGGLVLVAALTLLVIIGSILPGSVLGRGLDVAPLRWIGERSYGLYLWHWPVFVLVAAALPAWPRSGSGGWMLGAVAAGITLAAAAGSYRFVEQPVRRLGFAQAIRRFRKRCGGVGLGATVATMTTALLIASGVGTVGAVASDPGAGDAQTRIEQGRAAIERAPSPAPSAAPLAAPAATAAPLGGDQITAVGDSVMLASAPQLQAAFPGIQIDAKVSRQLAEAPGILSGMIAQGTLRQAVLLGLGTNGPIEPAVLDEIRGVAGPERQIIVVNVQAPRGWTAEVNAALARFAQQYRNVEFANWRDAIAGNLQLLARDQIHPGSRGSEIYAAAVRDAIQRLAELPPVLAPKDYGLAPVPQ